MYDNYYPLMTKDFAKIVINFITTWPFVGPTESNYTEHHIRLQIY